MMVTISAVRASIAILITIPRITSFLSVAFLGVGELTGCVDSKVWLELSVPIFWVVFVSIAVTGLFVSATFEAVVVLLDKVVLTVIVVMGPVVSVRSPCTCSPP